MTVHNHDSRDMQPPGECPGCDQYYVFEPEPPPPPIPREPILPELQEMRAYFGWPEVAAIVIGCLITGIFVVWLIFSVEKALS